MTAPVAEVAVERTVLPNGLVVCSEHLPGVRSVALGAWVRAGSVHETKRQMGVSHLLEHLVFKGTARRTAREIALALESKGGSVDAYTGREHTAFQAHVLDRDLSVAVDLIHDLMFAPLLREEDLQLERQVIYDEIALVQDTPDDQVFEEHNALLWGQHAYGYPILGTRESIGALKADNVRALHTRSYVPGNIVFAAAGNIEHSTLLDMLGTAGWGDIPSGPMPPRSQAPPSPATPSVAQLRRDTQQTHIVFGSTAIPMADRTRPAFLIVSSLLGGGMSSRLFQRVREELGLAYTVYAFSSLYSDTGVHGVYVGTGPATAGQARQAVADELQKLVQHGVPADELEVGKQQLIGQYLLSLESVGARMQRVASRELYNEPFRTVEEVIHRIERVSVADALATARAWFAPERQSIVILGPTN